MSEAVQLIVDGFVSLNNRLALEEMRDHREKLRNELLLRRGSVFDVSGTIKSVEDDLKVIEDAFERL